MSPRSRRSPPAALPHKTSMPHPHPEQCLLGAGSRCLPGTGETLRWDENSKQVLMHVYSSPHTHRIQLCWDACQTEHWAVDSAQQIHHKNQPSSFRTQTRLYGGKTSSFRTWARWGLRLAVMGCLCVYLFVCLCELGMREEWWTRARFLRRPPCHRMDESITPTEGALNYSWWTDCATECRPVAAILGHALRGSQVRFTPQTYG